MFYCIRPNIVLFSYSAFGWKCFIKSVIQLSVILLCIRCRSGFLWNVDFSPEIKFWTQNIFGWLTVTPLLPILSFKSRSDFEPHVWRHSSCWALGALKLLGRASVQKGSGSGAVECGRFPPGFVAGQKKMISWMFVTRPRHFLPGHQRAVTVSRLWPRACREKT